MLHVQELGQRLQPLTVPLIAVKSKALPNLFFAPLGTRGTVMTQISQILTNALRQTHVVIDDESHIPAQYVPCFRRREKIL